MTNNLYSCLSVNWRERMKVASSLKSLKKRDKNCQVVKRHGRVYVINKRVKRFKAKQA
jgi:large subunit ribosomal protein L36